MVKSIVLALAFMLFLPKFISASPPGEVVISEIMWMGSTVSSADEWIELYNRSDGTIDISGWTITRMDGGEERLMLSIESGQIAPHGYFLISNYPRGHSNTMLAVEPDLVDASVSLPNTKLQIRLYSGPWDQGAGLVDVADDGIGAPAAGDAELKRSMVRRMPPEDGTLALSWFTAELSSGWKEGASERGTPGGGEETTGAPPADVGGYVWGKIKSMFR